MHIYMYTQHGPPNKITSHSTKVITYSASLVLLELRSFPDTRPTQEIEVGPDPSLVARQSMRPGKCAQKGPG